jgi:hypothetical protein
MYVMPAAGSIAAVANEASANRRRTASRVLFFEGGIFISATA